jgi:hypothetical protein
MLLDLDPAGVLRAFRLLGESPVREGERESRACLVQVDPHPRPLVRRRLLESEGVAVDEVEE